MKTTDRLYGTSAHEIEEHVRQSWRNLGLDAQSLQEKRKKAPLYTFYEGPPSANGLPGLHHLMARTLKDLFCRYKTQQGYRVPRRAGWDTHGLPIELQVEKELGITKENIGNSISIADYNMHCRATVLRYTATWEKLTEKLGFWLDMQSAYRTCDPKYTESVWWSLNELYKRDFLYKGYSIQPYSPAAGTALSQHELNQPGCYKEVKDLAVVAQFQLLEAPNSYFLAWTTTPWTLPANSALAVGANIVYVEVETRNRYTGEPIRVWLAEAALSRYFDAQNVDKAPPVASLDAPAPAFSASLSPAAPLLYRVLSRCKGTDLEGKKYVQLLPYVPAKEPAFRLFCADFVTTTEGTGIVHIAPTFGTDDHELAKEKDIPSIFVKDPQGHEVPIVDEKGCFVPQITDFAGLSVKDFGKALASAASDPSDPSTPSTDRLIAQKLKAEGKLFHMGAYRHSYPHCWRTDRPILYYPIHSWFLRTSGCRDRLSTLNKSIHWQPASTGTGRFGKWLDQLKDWNISRSRFWGTPLPIWRNKDDTARICIGSYAQLHEEVAKSIQAGLMSAPLPPDFDPHRPFVDDVVLVGPSGEPLRREEAVIDVWFDSGAMPYAQWHYPFENKEAFEAQFPADFIAEGVDQTRGWFFTLHALSGMLFDKIAYKRALSCGLLLAKDGSKMSKRLGNAIDPIQVLDTYGSDATRWYLVTSASPWENLRCDVEGIATVKRTFFGTLINIFDFFRLYAGLDDFHYSLLPLPPPSAQPLLDRWLYSRLKRLQDRVTAHYEAYEPKEAGRLIQHFVTEDLSNWYIRLNRKRFWQGEKDANKNMAYQTLYEALRMVTQLAAPIAPFLSDHIFQVLLGMYVEPSAPTSVHIEPFPAHRYPRDVDLEAAMSAAQRISSLVHALRKRLTIKVRQPLSLLLVAGEGAKEQHIEALVPLILQEVNIHELRFSSDLSISVHKRVRPQLRRLGPRYGTQIQALREALSSLSQQEIVALEHTKSLNLEINNKTIALTLEDLIIDSESIKGWEIAKDHDIVVAIDVHITEPLMEEGLAREFVNKIQHLRKTTNFDVQDKVHIRLYKVPSLVTKALQGHQTYICQETQAAQLEWIHDNPPTYETLLLNEHTLHLSIERLSAPS